MAVNYNSEKKNYGKLVMKSRDENNRDTYCESQKNSFGGPTQNANENLQATNRPSIEIKGGSAIGLGVDKDKNNIGPDGAAID
ncbi:hypothetical protein Tco_0467378 [Tanacetum coccineum]